MDAAVIAAIIAAAITFLAFLGDRYREALARRGKLAAEALSDALLWLEIPYRVRRRTDNNAATLSDLAERIHRLQERQVFHTSWLQVEIPDAHAPYVALLKAVKQQVREYIQAAWRSDPAERPEDMNVGPLYQADVTSEIEGYVQAIRGAVGIWRWPWSTGRGR